MRYLIVLLLISVSAQAQDVIITDDLALLAAIERSRQTVIIEPNLDGYEYVNRDAFNQDSQHPRQHHQDIPLTFVDPVAKTYSYKPYRPNVFNVPDRNPPIWGAPR